MPTLEHIALVFGFIIEAGVGRSVSIKDNVNFSTGNVLEFNGERANMISVGRASFGRGHVIVENCKKPDGVRRVIVEFDGSINSVCAQVNHERGNKCKNWF